MALVDSGRAIGAVSRLLQNRLTTALGATPSSVNVSIGGLGPSTQSNPRVNLFLYEVELDGHLRNVTLDEGQPPPLWLVLHYLMVAFDADSASDSDAAQNILGEAMSALQALNFFTLDGLFGGSDIVAPLNSNPDSIKVTFDSATPDLLSKLLLQRADEPYPCATAFQVRPVMIAPAEPTAYSLLVGVDYTTNSIPGQAAVHVPVLPSLGPAVSRVEPEEFETGTSVTIYGNDLNASGIAIQFGGVEFSATAQRSDRLTFVVDPFIDNGQEISAGSHPLAVTQLLPSGRRRSSNLLVAGLLPRLSSAIATNVLIAGTPAPPSSVVGVITLHGFLLGTDGDDIYAALFRDGAVVQMYDAFVTQSDQQQLRFTIPTEKAVAQGEYRLILRVNGRQARTSPTVVLTSRPACPLGIRRRWPGCNRSRCGCVAKYPGNGTSAAFPNQLTAGWCQVTDHRLRSKVSTCCVTGILAAPTSRATSLPPI